MATRLPNGKYRAQVYIGTDESGKRLYKSFMEDTADEAEYAALTYKLGKGKRTDAPRRNGCLHPKQRGRAFPCYGAKL